MAARDITPDPHTYTVRRYKLPCLEGVPLRVYRCENNISIG